MRDYGYEDMLATSNGETQKEHLIQILLTFDAFCKEHGLKYYLSGGTLLGAIRHHGFIPWDDDVDVNMPRPDCEKLMELSGGRIGPYVLVPMNYRLNYHTYYWKLYDETMLVSKRSKEGIAGKVYPIFIDIFAIEGLPDTEEETTNHYNLLKKVREPASYIWANKVPQLEHFKGRKSAKKRQLRKRQEYIKEMETKDPQQLFDDVLAVHKKYPFETSEYVGVMGTNVHFEVERVKKADYLPQVDVEFEGHLFKAPANYDTYLRQLYGDNYFGLPPVRSRVSNHGHVPFLSKIDPAKSAPKVIPEKWLSYWCPGEPEITVGVVGLIKDESLGALMNARSLEYLIGTEIRKERPSASIRFVEADLLGRCDEQVNVGTEYSLRINNFEKFHPSGYTEYQKYLRQLGKAELAATEGKLAAGLYYRLSSRNRNKSYNDTERLLAYFQERLPKVQVIVVDGPGVLDYSTGECAYALKLLTSFAERHGIPVIGNALGASGRNNPAEYRARDLKAALSSKALRHVSVRAEQDALTAYAAGASLMAAADAAFFADETAKKYDEITEAENAVADDAEKVVGIEVIRNEAFLGYPGNCGNPYEFYFVRDPEKTPEEGFEKIAAHHVGRPSDELLDEEFDEIEKVTTVDDDDKELDAMINDHSDGPVEDGAYEAEDANGGEEGVQGDLAVKNRREMDPPILREKSPLPIGIRFYLSLMKELREKNISYRLFTSGSVEDVVFARQILNKAALDYDMLELRPLEEGRLFESISGFKEVITPRQLTAAAAVSAGVPVVLLNMQNGADEFAARLGMEDLTFEADDLNAQEIVRALDAASAKVGNLNTENMKKFARDEVASYTREIILPMMKEAGR